MVTINTYFCLTELYDKLHTWNCSAPIGERRFVFVALSILLLTLSSTLSDETSVSGRTITEAQPMFSLNVLFVSASVVFNMAVRSETE